MIPYYTLFALFILLAGIWKIFSDFLNETTVNKKFLHL